MIFHGAHTELRYAFGSFSEQGKRKKNEDSILIRSARIGENSVCMGIVCDGVGGLRRGEVASCTTVRLLSEWFERMALKSKHEIDYEYLKKSMIKNIHKINLRLVDYGLCNGIRCGTTLSGFILFNDKYTVINIGDSRAYLLSGGLFQLTTDDFHGGGLTQCLGTSREVTVNADEGILRDGEALLICTDGFYVNMDEEKVELALKITGAENADDAMRLLIEDALSRCDDDNATAGFVRLERRNNSAGKRFALFGRFKKLLH